MSPSWQTGSRLALHAIGATAGNPPKAPPERRRPRPGEGQGEPVNAAACWQRLPPCPRCDRPTDRRQSTLGKAPKLCPGTVGRSFPEALSLPPSSSQGEAQGKGGTSLFPWMFKGNSLQGCSGKRSASGRRHQFKCGQRANRAAAVHTFTVWAGMLSIRGRGTLSDLSVFGGSGGA